MTIFISIASFCDPVLDFTIKQALKMAKHPESLHFGIVEQNYNHLALKEMPKNISYLLIDPVHSRGACWARSLGMTMYGGQDWFFQIDSHMDFDQDWDDILVNQAIELQQKNKGVVITSYPNPFIFEHGLPVKRPVTKSILAHVVKKESKFQNGLYTLGFEAHPFNSNEAVRGFHLGAGCLFTSGDFVNCFPYDPYLYFIGEEQTLAARIFTHGWDIFHTPGLPIYHLYNTKSTNQVPRILHWEKSIDAARSQSWVHLEKRSKDRIKDLLGGGKELGAYGLGHKRSLGEYAALSGINYMEMTVAEKAYRGYWKY